MSLFVVPGATSFDGTYKLDDAQSDNIDTAINQGVEGLNFLVRHFARNRLKKLNPAYRKSPSLLLLGK